MRMAVGLRVLVISNSASPGASISGVFIRMVQEIPRAKRLIFARLYGMLFLRYYRTWVILARINRCLGQGLHTLEVR